MSLLVAAAPLRRTARAVCLLALLVLLSWCAVRVRGAEPPPRRVVQVTLEDQVIDPVAVRLVARALREAQAIRAECLIIQLDTPGGLMESTRLIVKDILQADVPVVVYVAPRGARAGSAGVFITLAAHVAVMAPGTNIGAA